MNSYDLFALNKPKSMDELMTPVLVSA